MPATRGRAADRSDRTATIVVVAVVAVLGCAAFAWVYGARLPYFQAGPIRSDAIGYYVYLPAVLLDHDYTLAKTVQRDFGGNVALVQGVRPAPTTNRLLDQYGIGEAVMLSPFFGLGDGIAAATGQPRDGFSRPYQVTAAAAGLVYALLGLVLTASVLLRWFRPGTVVVTLLAITFGTDLFHYATYDSVYSHAFSFFLVAAVLRLTIAVWERPRFTAVAALAVAAGLVALVRPPNLVVLLFSALIGVESLAGLRARGAALLRRIDLVATGIGIFLVVVLPQLAYWHAITGHFIANGYPDDQRLDLLHPHLIGVLFSVRKGLFFWAPLLLFAVAGLPLLRRRAPALLVPAVAYVIVEAWVVSSWSQWWYGGSFGMRPFVEALPVLALGLAALVETVRRSTARRVLLAGIAAATLLSVHAMVLYWLKVISYDNTTWHHYLSSFGHL